jgi:hypothetical protein
MQIFILSKQNGKGFTNCTNLKDLKTELYNLVAANNASYEHYNFDVTNLTSKSSGDFLSLELSFAAYPDVLRKIANHSLNLYVIYKEQVLTKCNNLCFGKAKNTGEVTGITFATKPPLSDSLVQRVSSYCSADFCDAKCTLKRQDYTTFGTVSEVFDAASFVDSSLPSDNNAERYNFANLVFISGQNAGLNFTIKNLDGKKITILQIPYYPIKTGDEYSVSLACSKTIVSCKSYGNLNNFRGFV